MNRKTLFLAVSLGVLGCGQSSSPPSPYGQSVQALSADLVISQVYGGGSTTGAIYRYDYVELFNRGTATVSLGGLSLQYARADIPTWSVLPLPTVNVDPGHYFLIRVYRPTTLSGADLPTPDFTEADGDAGVGTNYGTQSGLVALVTGLTPLTCGADAGPCTSSTIVDFLGYGVGATASKPPPVYEGSGGAPMGLATAAVFRKGGGCVETDDNAADFEQITISTTGPGPRNSASTPNPCSVDGGVGDGSVPDAVAVDSVSVDSAVAETTADTAVVEDTLADTGAAADSGSAEDSAMATDSAVPVTDTGAADSGVTPVADDELVDDGCNCHAAGRAGADGGPLLAALLALLATARRRP